jgi:iron complex outermembrane receptor protein
LFQFNVFLKKSLETIGKEFYMRGTLKLKRFSRSNIKIPSQGSHIAWLLIFFSGYLFGQVEGIIVDANNQSPLPGAIIMLSDSTFSASDQNGLFSVGPIEYPETIKAYYIGYETYSIRIEKQIDYLKIELAASNYMLGEVIVTAYEGRQKYIESPGSIAMLPQKEMKIDNDAYFIPSLNRVTGVFAHTGAFNTNRITIRGIGSRSLFITAKIRAYYDNIPLTSGDGETTVEDIDPNLIDRIEAIKGPSSSLYGAGLGGTLLINSKSPSNQEKYMRYGITGGSYGYLKNDLSFTYGGEKNRIGVIVNRIRSDGYRENNKYERFTSGFNFKSFLSDKSAIRFLTTFIGLYARIPSSIDSLAYQTDPRSAARNWAETEGFEDNHKIITGMGFNHIFKKNSSLDVSIFHTYRNSYELRPFNILADNNNAVGGRLKYEYRNIWNGYQFDFIVGGEYFIDFYKWQTYENDNKEMGDLLSDNKESRENINTFIKADLTFPFKTYLTIGFNINRTNYDYESLYSLDGTDNSGDYSFGTSVSPRIAISHPLRPGIFIYGNISHGFSPPSLVETLTPSGTINPDIKPEAGINYEIGTKGMVFRNKLFYDLALFTMHISDLIVAQRIGEDEFIGVNAGKTVNNGLELTLNYNFLTEDFRDRSLTGFISYTYADYVFKEFVDSSNDYSGNELTGVPGHVFNIGLNGKSSIGIYGNLNYQYVDEMPMRDDNSIYSDPYALVNLKAGYTKSVSDHFEIDVHGIINNILNEKYASMISVNAPGFGGNLPRYYYPGLPTNFFLGVEVRYNF